MKEVYGITLAVYGMTLRPVKGEDLSGGRQRDRNQRAEVITRKKAKEILYKDRLCYKRSVKRNT